MLMKIPYKYKFYKLILNSDYTESIKMSAMIERLFVWIFVRYKYSSKLIKFIWIRSKGDDQENIRILY